MSPLATALCASADEILRSYSTSRPYFSHEPASAMTCSSGRWVGERYGKAILSNGFLRLSLGERFRREQLVDGKAALGEALFEVVAHGGVERFAIGLDSVRPRVGAHQFTVLALQLDHPWNHQQAMQ